MHHRNAVFQGFFRAAEIDFLAQKLNAARIFGVNAEQAFEQRGFACAVFAHQRVHRMGFYGEVHAIERFHAGKGFVHIAHGEQDFVFRLRLGLRRSGHVFGLVDWCAVGSGVSGCLTVAVI